MLLRDYFGGDPSQRESASLLALYLSRELTCLSLTDEAALIKGNIRFSLQPFAHLAAAS